MEDFIDKVTEITGIKFEDMNEIERSHVMNFSKMIATKEVTVDMISEFIVNLKSAIELELVKTDEFIYYFGGLFKRVNRQHILLKARLSNMIAFEGILQGKEKAAKAIELYLHSLKTK